MSSNPIILVNAESVQGMSPGYTTSAGIGLNANLSSGIINNQGTIVNYAGGVLPLTPNATNYLYMNTISGCVPLVKLSGFSSSDIPLAEIQTNANSVILVTDVRSFFTTSSGGSGNANISLTTLGTSGASTLISGVLNIPQYSGGGNANISLTTIGTSGASTLISGVLNIPQYSGGGNANTSFGAMTSGTNNSAIMVVSSPGSLTGNIQIPYTNLTGTTPTWNQNTTGTATYANTANAVSYSNLTGSVPTWNQNTTGTASYANTANAVSYSNLTGSVPTWNQNTTGLAATATNLSSNGTANQVWSMNSGATAQGWSTVSGGGGNNATSIQSVSVSNASPTAGQHLVYKATGTTYIPGFSYKNLISVVAEYGADPTGVVDASSAFQNALNAVTAARPGIYIQSGTYKINTALTDPTSGLLQFVIGDGWQSTILSSTSTNTIFNFTHITSTTTSGGFKMEGVSFQGGSVAPTTPYGTQTGVILSAQSSYDAINVKVTDCWFGYWSGTALTIYSSGAYFGSVLNKIENCEFIFCGNGLVVGGGASNDSTTLTLINCYGNFIIGNAFRFETIQAVSLITCAVDNSGMAYLFKGCSSTSQSGCYMGAPVPYNQSITSIARSGSTVTATLANNFVAGQWAVISGYTSTYATAYNGFVQILTASGTNFTYTSPGGSGTLGTASGGLASVYPGWGTYFGTGTYGGSSQCTVNGYDCYYATTQANSVAFFVDQNSGSIDIAGYNQNTAGGTYDVYIAGYGVTLRASSLIGQIYNDGLAIPYAAPSALWTSGQISTTSGFISTIPVNAQTANYTAQFYDIGAIISETSSSATTVFIPTDASITSAVGMPMPIGSQLTVVQGGTGNVTIAATTPGTTTVLPPVGSTAVTPGQYSFITAVKMANNLWYVSGPSSGSGATINYSNNEIPSGTPNGSLTTFTLAHTPIAGSLVLTLNGIQQNPNAGVSYSLSTATITMVTAPNTGAILLANYRY